MIHNQCHVFFSTPKIFSFGMLGIRKKIDVTTGHPNLAIMFHQQGLVESLTSMERYEMLGSQDYDATKDRTTPQKKKKT